MAKATLRLVSPAAENRTVTPRRKANTAYRPREHLTEAEVGRLIKVAKNNRWGLRDSAMILIAFRHGLRASELCGLQWSDVEFEAEAEVYQCAWNSASTVAVPESNEPAIAMAEGMPFGSSRLIMAATNTAATGRTITK